MSDLKVAQFHPKHLELMEIRELELNSHFKSKEGWRYAEKLAVESIQAATFMYEGRVLFCAGFSEVWPTVLDMWMIPSIYIKQAPSLLFCRTLRRYIESIADTFKARRVQTVSYHDAFHAKWMRFLKFKNETPHGMEHFAPNGQTMCVYSRVF